MQQPTATLPTMLRHPAPCGIQSVVLSDVPVLKHLPWKFQVAMVTVLKQKLTKRQQQQQPAWQQIAAQQVQRAL
jgi:hypothetical protein